MLDALACIGTAVALFSVVKRQHEGFAHRHLAGRHHRVASGQVDLDSLVLLPTSTDPVDPNHATFRNQRRQSSAEFAATATKINHNICRPGTMPREKPFVHRSVCAE